MRLNNPFKKSEEATAATKNDNAQATDEQVRVVEREITLSVVNEKLNYLVGLVQEIHEAMTVEEAEPKK